MAILRAKADHLPQLRRLLHHSYTRFMQFGHEGLAALVTDSLVIMAPAERERELWGALVIQIEPRPETLSPAAPDRAYLVGLFLTRQPSPSRAALRFVEAGLVELREWGRSFQLIVQAPEPWLAHGLTQAGFTLAEQVRSYKHTQQVVPPTAEPARLRPALSQDLAALAQLDARTFPPLWHMGDADLAGLLIGGRLQLAELEGRTVGYSALIMPESCGALPAVDLLGDEEPAGAFLARLAVHPHAQGQGIGRQLLTDCLIYSHAHGATIVQLNTQVSNHQSQRLYAKAGFRPTGRTFPVYTYYI